VDTFLAAGNEAAEDVYTFHAFKGERFTPADTDKPIGRIDWILIRDEAGQMTVRSHEILRDGDEEAGRYPSDHYPVLPSSSWAASSKPFPPPTDKRGREPHGRSYREGWGWMNAGR